MPKSIILLSKDVTKDVSNSIHALSGDEEIQTSNKAYDEMFALCGSWNSWIEHVAVGKDYMSQEPIYNKYYCVSEFLGRANAEIITLALEDGKECYFLNEETLLPIVGVSKVGEDWANGWKVLYLR